MKVRLFKFAAITGTVVDESGEPLVGVQIRAYRRTLMAGKRLIDQGGAQSTTDDRGMYRIGGLAPGEYIVAAPTVQTSAPAGFQLQGPLPPDLISTLAGPGGGFSLNTGGSPVTPDGRFVLQNSGRTIMPASPASHAMVYGTMYYPSATTTQQASPLIVKSGEERAGIDLQLRPVPALNIGGRLMGPDGPAANWGVHLVPGDTTDLSTDPDVATSITDADGSFMFLAVPAGQYVIQTVRVPRQAAVNGNFTVVQSSGGNVAVATSFSSTNTIAPAPPQPPTQPTLFVVQPVTLATDDLTDLTVSLRTGFSVTGRIDFQGSSPRPTADRLPSMAVTLEPADAKIKANSTPGRVDQAGNFTAYGLLPGKYVVRVGGPGGNWTFKSALLGGVDVSDMPLQVEDRDVSGIIVTFADTATALSGIVKSADGVADDSSAVVVFPADSRAWVDYGLNPRRVRTARTTKTGLYTLNALPPGDYYVVAFSEEYAGEWQDPRFLDQLSRVASRVTLGDGEKRTQDLTRQTARPGQAPAPAFVFDESPSGPGPYVDDDVQVLPPTGPRPQTPPRDPRTAPVAPASPAAPPRDTTIPSTGTAVVSGIVVLDDGSEQPVRHARVTIRATDTRAERTITTDETGRFAFTALPPATYNLSASKTAYVSAFYGSTHAGRGPGTPITMANGQALTDLKLAIPRGGVVTGRVFDDFGAPVPNAIIRLMQYRTFGGEKSLVATSVSVQTDDRGIYRAYGLTPGAYAINVTPPPISAGTGELRQLSNTEMQNALSAVQTAAARPGPATPGMVGATNTAAHPPADATPAPGALMGRTVGYSTMYYPGTWSATEAQTVNVTAGQELSGIDVPLHLLPTSRLSGMIVGIDGRPAAGVQMTLVPLAQNGTVFAGFGSMRSDAEGKFSTTNISPGHYMLSARASSGAPPPPPPPGAGPIAVTALPPPPPPPPPGGGIAIGGGPIFVVSGSSSNLYAEQELDFAGEDIAGLTLTLQEGMTLAGRFVFEGRALAPPADLTRLSLNLVPVGRGVSFNVPTPKIDASGAFTMTGITPGRYRLIANVPGGTGNARWQLKSATVDGHDTVDDALEIKAGQNITGAVVTFTDEMAELSGRILDAAGKPAPGYTILLFSADRAQWTNAGRRLPQPIQPGNDGSYKIPSLPAGDYYLAAVTDLDPQDWGDPTYLEQVAAVAQKITLKDGEKQTKDFKIAR